MVSLLATMAAAGRQADLIHFGLTWPGVLISHDKDGHSTRGYLAAAYPLPMGLGYVQRRAYGLLTDHWFEVHKIAGELIERGEWRPCNDAA